MKIAFGMNIDAVNKQDSILNVYLSKSLKSLMSYFFDPFMNVTKDLYIENIKYILIKSK